MTLPPLALLSGGLATRMRPMTERVPKALLEVAGEPFIAHQLRLLKTQNVGRVVVCAGFLGEMIEEFVGDGRRFGIEVRYSYDGPVLLGTGGALRRAAPLLGDEFLVMYGDSYLTCPFGKVVEAFRNSRQPALMTVLRNEDRWDTSNVDFRDGRIRRYDKRDRTPEMRHVDYGLGVMRVGAFAGRNENESFDLAAVLTQLASTGQLAAFEVFDRFYEIGSPGGLVETDEFLRGKPAE